MTNPLIDPNILVTESTSPASVIWVVVYFCSVTTRIVQTIHFDTCVGAKYVNAVQCANHEVRKSQLPPTVPGGTS